MGPHRREGRWTTILGRRADPRLHKKQPAPPPLPGGVEVDRVPTGGGLLVSRRAVWQSIAGSHVSGSLDLRQPTGRRYGALNIDPTRSTA